MLILYFGLSAIKVLLFFKFVADDSLFVADDRPQNHHPFNVSIMLVLCLMVAFRTLRFQTSQEVAKTGVIENQS